MLYSKPNIARLAEGRFAEWSIAEVRFVVGKGTRSNKAAKCWAISHLDTIRSNVLRNLWTYRKYMVRHQHLYASFWCLTSLKWRAKIWKNVYYSLQNELQKRERLWVEANNTLEIKFDDSVMRWDEVWGRSSYRDRCCSLFANAPLVFMHQKMGSHKGKLWATMWGCFLDHGRTHDVCLQKVVEFVGLRGNPRVTTDFLTSFDIFIWWKEPKKQCPAEHWRVGTLDTTVFRSGNERYWDRVWDGEVFAFLAVEWRNGLQHL